MKGFITYNIQQGDTLQRIASKFKLENWQQIAALNNLSYPFIDDSILYADNETRNPHLRYIGDNILIPAEYNRLPQSTNSAELEKLAYGSDLDVTGLKIDEYDVFNIENNGELRDDGRGDLAIVEGIKNLRQAILLRLMTPKGTLPLHPDYGSDMQTLVGKPRTYKQLVKIKLEAQCCIKSDFRVKDVREVSAHTTDKGGVMLACTIVPIEPYSAFRFAHEFLLL